MSALTQMLETWEARSRGANPCDAMLINKHIREVRELLAASHQKPETAPPPEGGAITAGNGLSQIDACEVLSTVVHFIPSSEPELMRDVLAICHGLRTAQQAQEPVEQVDLYGTKDGVLVHLGKAAMPPRMKARELAREQFGHFEDDDGSDAELCFGALEQLVEWMYAQGFKIAHPAPKQAEPAWRPIETAPKDGTVIDLWHEEFGRWPGCNWGLPEHTCGEAGSLCDDDVHSMEEGWVTDLNEITFPASEYRYWMPIPAAPGAKP